MRISLFVLLLFAIEAAAQKPVSPPNVNPSPVKPSFNDGFYTSYDDFRNNRPSKTLSEVAALEMAFDEDENLFYVEYKEKDDKPKPRLGQFWGMCLHGQPYIWCLRDEKDSIGMFVKMHVLGKLCYFYYNGFAYEDVVMKIYNPLTGTVSARKKITNRERKRFEWLMRFDEGKKLGFNPENFKRMISDDAKLQESFSKYSRKEAEEKLFKTVLIYNDRNPLRLH